MLVNVKLVDFKTKKHITLSKKSLKRPQAKFSFLQCESIHDNQGRANPIIVNMVNWGLSFLI